MFNNTKVLETKPLARELLSLISIKGMTNREGVFLVYNKLKNLNEEDFLTTLTASFFVFGLPREHLSITSLRREEVVFPEEPLVDDIKLIENLVEVVDGVKNFLSTLPSKNNDEEAREAVYDLLKFFYKENPARKMALIGVVIQLGDAALAYLLGIPVKNNPFYRPPTQEMVN